MDGPGPATQASAAARSRRAAKRASGEALKSAQQSKRALKPSKRQRANESSDDEDDEDDDGEDDGEEDSEDKSPVYHHQIWRRLLRKGNMGGRLRYVNAQPESGDDPMDITAVESTQITWDMRDRRFWPNNLTLWDLPNPRNNPTYEIGVMMYKGRVVLDYKGNPIRDFRIPLTISSKVEGLRVEAWMRKDDRLTLGDIEARMWTKLRPNGRRVPMFDKRALSKRASNARIRAGLIGWVPKSGRHRQTAFMDSLRTPAQRARNLAMDRDLNSQERASHHHIGLDEKRVSDAPTRQERIDKIKRAAGIGSTDAGPSSGAADAEPSDPATDASGDDDDLSDSTDGNDAIQENSTQDPASDDDTEDEGSLASSIIDPLDSRHDQPQNPHEEALLRAALAETVHDFLALTENAPTPTVPRDNYFSQWGMLQEEFRIWWVNQGNTDEAPKLKARGRWTGGISEYRSARLT